MHLFCEPLFWSNAQPKFVEAIMNELQSPTHNEVRKYLRILGPALALLGMVFTVAGMVSFFSAFNYGGPPRFFWCAFIGLPLIAIGVGISKFAYLGSITRYVAGESAPVAKDTFNYMVDGTKDSIRETFSAIGEGLRDVREMKSLPCQKCGTKNDSSANFCSQCGETIPKTRCCPHCGDSNPQSASFCDCCGAKVT